MKSLLTPLFSNFLINDIKDHFINDANTFVFIGRSLDFGSNSANIPDIIWTTNERNQVYRNMVGAKKIQLADVQPVVSRVDWAVNTKYDSYEDNIELTSYIDYFNIGTANANANTILTGSANIAGSNVLVGNGTSFLTFVFPGDLISVNSSIKSVVSVTNNSHLIVNSAFANVNTGSSITKIANARILIANSASFIGNVETGNVVVIGEDAREVIAILSNKVISLNANLTYSNSNVTVSRKDNTFPFTANTFYVRNTRDQVFKCLFNNSYANSTIEPTIDIDGQLPENAFIQTADGYKWKYMYTIPPGLKQKFFTNKWMPVVSDPAVTAAAIDGRIDIVNVLWGGSGHVQGGNSNTAAILSVTGTDGAGANLYAKVVNGSIESVTILNGGNNYTRGTVVVNDLDRLGTLTLAGTVNVSGAVVTGNASNLTYFVGTVKTNDIITVDGQSRNVVTVVNSTYLTVNTAFSNMNSQIAVVTRSNAAFDIQIGPHGGHGSDPVTELRAHSLMITVELNDTENDTIPMSDSTNVFDFNQVGILQDPLVANGAFYANGTNYRTSTRLLIADPGITNFTNDETVYLGSSIETATAIANVAHWAPGDNYLYINNITGTFAAQQIIKGATSGVSTPILEIANSDIRTFSGDVIYAENRTNVVRKDNQIDQIKIVLSF
jgi:hypothetical protein